MSSYSALNSLLSGSSSSSVDLSSILQAAFGASSSGIDVTSAVNAAVTAARAPETAWQNEQYTLQTQVSALQQIQAGASNLDNDVIALNSIAGPLSARTVSSSNSSLVTASAASGAITGNHVVVVNNLATTASWTSATFTNSSTALPAGTFSITSNGTSTNFTTDGTQTLSDVANQINNSNLGLTANVITDASGSRLAIVANSSGASANFTISGDTGFGFSQAVTGTNASLTVDGIQISSASNTVTGALSGVTLNLLSANPGVQVSLAVSPDTSQASSAISTFVSDYNTLIKQLSSQFTFNGTSEGVLATDSAVRNLQSQLLGVLGYTASSGSGTSGISNLSSMGISVNNDGTLTLDTAQLQSVLQSNFSGVQNFFQGSAQNGFANSLDQQLTSFISPAGGAFTVDLQSMNNQISDLQNSISNFETNYITPLTAQLKSEYSQAEILLQQLPIQMKQISTELGQNSSNG